LSSTGRDPVVVSIVAPEAILRLSDSVPPLMSSGATDTTEILALNDSTLIKIELYYLNGEKSHLYYNVWSYSYYRSLFNFQRFDLNFFHKKFGRMK
jgi:hypothetical protein